MFIKLFDVEYWKIGFYGQIQIFNMILFGGKFGHVNVGDRRH